MKKQQPNVKLVRKPTPVRNIVLAVSLTCNAFAGGVGYLVHDGYLVSQAAQVETQKVALYSAEQDYLTQIDNARREASRR